MGMWSEGSCDRKSLVCHAFAVALIGVLALTSGVILLFVPFCADILFARMLRALWNKWDEWLDRRQYEQAREQRLIAERLVPAIGCQKR